MSQLPQTAVIGKADSSRETRPTRTLCFFILVFQGFCLASGKPEATAEFSYRSIPAFDCLRQCGLDTAPSCPPFLFLLCSKGHFYFAATVSPYGAHDAALTAASPRCEGYSQMRE